MALSVTWKTNLSAARPCFLARWSRSQLRSQDTTSLSIVLCYPSCDPGPNPFSLLARISEVYQVIYEEEGLQGTMRTQPASKTRRWRTLAWLQGSCAWERSMVQLCAWRTQQTRRPPSVVPSTALCRLTCLTSPSRIAPSRCKSGR